MNEPGRVWPRAELRTGDADRQGVVAELQRHFIDGRLSSDELSERVTQALNARTFGELAVPLGDLPILANTVALAPEDVTPPEDHPQSGFRPPLGAILVAIGMVALMWMFMFPTMHWGGMPFWPLFVFGFFFMGRPRRVGRRDRWRRGGPPTRYL